MATTILSLGQRGASLSRAAMCTGAAKTTVNSAWLMLGRLGVSYPCHEADRGTHMNSEATGTLMDAHVVKPRSTTYLRNLSRGYYTN